MRVILQRVLHASCTIEGQITGKIAQGYCLFTGFGPEDTKSTVEKMASKILRLRIFSDEDGKMNRSLAQTGGSILSISQFTLYADCQKGNRPGFSGAAAPEKASALYEYFNEVLSAGAPVQTGVFGADMKIDLLNDGPVTLILDSKELKIA